MAATYPQSVGVETTKRMQMEESTQYSKRFVTVEQTTKVIHLRASTETSNEAKPCRAAVAVPELQLEPFPFVPDPPQPVRSVAKASPQLKPKKFVPGETRESDYESDYESAKIRPKWTPAGAGAGAGAGDSADPKYRVVRPPSHQPARRAADKREGGARTPTPPTVFDHPPTFDGPPRPIISPMDILEFKNSLALDVADSQRILVKPKAVHASKRPAAQPVPDALQSAPRLVYHPSTQQPLASVARKSLNNEFK